MRIAIQLLLLIRKEEMISNFTIITVHGKSRNKKKDENTSGKSAGKETACIL